MQEDRKWHMETAAPPLGLKVEDERVSKTSFDIGRGCFWKRTWNLLVGYHRLGGRIEVAGNVAAIIALEGLQADITQG